MCVCVCVCVCVCCEHLLCQATVLTRVVTVSSRPYCALCVCCRTKGLAVWNIPRYWPDSVAYTPVLLWDVPNVNDTISAFAQQHVAADIEVRVRVRVCVCVRACVRACVCVCAFPAFLRTACIDLNSCVVRNRFAQFATRSIRAVDSSVCLPFAISRRRRCKSCVHGCAL